MPNGTYSQVSLATDADSDTDTSIPISVTVNNPAPTSTVLIPSSGVSVSGTPSVLNASTSANLTSVIYELSGGPSDLADHVVATGTPRTTAGWPSGTPRTCLMARTRFRASPTAVVTVVEANCCSVG